MPSSYSIALNCSCPIVVHVGSHLYEHMLLHVPHPPEVRGILNITVSDKMARSERLADLSLVVSCHRLVERVQINSKTGLCSGRQPVNTNIHGLVDNLGSCGEE